MSSDSIGLFIFIKLYMEKLITQFGDKGLQAVSAVFMPAVGVMVSVWVMLEGYRILNGQTREPLTAVFWKVGKVVVITTIAGWIMGNTGEIREWFNDNIKDAITTVIVGNEYGSPESMVDATLLIMQLVMATFGQIHATVNPEQGNSMANFISMSGISQGAPAVVAGSLLLLNQVAISLSLMTAPAFILALLYEPTKGYFQGWLKFTLSALLTLAVLTAMVTICLKIVLVYSSAVLAKYEVLRFLESSTEGIAQTTMMQGGLGLR
ncbi:hypothetical protein PL75_01770 [Neisseria arctica]|uniref:Uncharacterized protein n=1 Tax=Neisseria arctica TaxID=1470200 RepID=A0A0J1C5R1_9NEIS|nr:type IV secretion system protein [Neisseria arctica]KLT73698.1 hypothetical protein PL75_01770 [Neisseria arctica]UOO85833.1 type IV secretion system protein [Neisseria arctica]